MNISKALRGLHKNSGNGASSWLEVAALLADVAFETDVKGVFTAFGPGDVLGFPQSQLLSTNAAAFFAGPENAFVNIFTGICTEKLAWHGRAMLQNADGTQSQYRLAMAPLVDEHDIVTGVAGLLFNLNAPELAGPDFGRVTEFGTAQASALLCPETGLWSASNFTEQAARRFDRLDVEDLPGTLILLGFGRAKPHLRKPTATLLAEELRDIVRPTDMLGRLDATTIALWCDGMDHLTAAERAARLCTRLPVSLPDETPISAGLVTRWPGTADTPVQLIERAGAALRQADLATLNTACGTW